MTYDRGEAGAARNYFAYPLRLWQEKGSESARWRASLQDPHSGERVGFANLEDLFAFLRQEMAGEAHGSRLNLDLSPRFCTKFREHQTSRKLWLRKACSLG